jgi:protein-L-isoaspartate(D-aspartate) O-methyltransferase
VNFSRWISPVAIFPCEGARDPLSEAALAEGFAKGGWEEVARLCRGLEMPEGHCWLRTQEWCLAWDPTEAHGPRLRF